MCSGGEECSTGVGMGIGGAAGKVSICWVGLICSILEFS